MAFIITIILIVQNPFVGFDIFAHAFILLRTLVVYIIITRALSWSCVRYVQLVTIMRREQNDRWRFPTIYDENSLLPGKKVTRVSVAATLTRAGEGSGMLKLIFNVTVVLV